jgi:G3E family GTPase
MWVRSTWTLTDEIKNSKLIQEDAEMAEMHNGCIYCALRGDLLKTVKSPSQEEKFDCLVIESTGISEPLPAAQSDLRDGRGRARTTYNGRWCEQEAHCVCG